SGAASGPRYLVEDVWLRGHERRRCGDDVVAWREVGEAIHTAVVGQCRSRGRREGTDANAHETGGIALAAEARRARERAHLEADDRLAGLIRHCACDDGILPDAHDQSG